MSCYDDAKARAEKSNYRLNQTIQTAESRANQTYKVRFVDVSYWEVGGRQFQTEAEAEAYAVTKRIEATQLLLASRYLGFIRDKLNGRPWTGENCAHIMVEHIDEYVATLGMKLVPINEEEQHGACKCGGFGGTAKSSGKGTPLARQRKKKSRR